MWTGSREASDEHLIGAPPGVLKARTVTALPEGQRLEAKAIDEMPGTPWRPSTEHRGTKVRTQITDEEEQGNDETAEDVAKKQDVTLTKIGQTNSVTMKARGVLKNEPHPGCLGCKYITGDVATQPRHSKECKIRIMVEKTRTSNAVASGMQQRASMKGEVSFKDHDEGTASEGGTPEKQEPTVTSSEEVHMSDPSSRQQHGNAKMREET